MKLSMFTAECILEELARNQVRVRDLEVRRFGLFESFTIWDNSFGVSIPGRGMISDKWYVSQTPSAPSFVACTAGCSHSANVSPGIGGGTSAASASGAILVAGTGLYPADL